MRPYASFTLTPEPQKDKAAYLTRESSQVCERKSSSPCLLACGAAHPLPVGQFCLAWVVVAGL